MATSFTPRLKLAKQANADNIGAWEIPLNQGFDDADDRLFRSGAVDPTGVEDADYIGQRYLDTVTEFWYTATAAGSPGTWVQSEIGQIGNSVQSIEAGVAASIPTPSAATAGSWYLETDTKLLKRDNGTIYEVISPALDVGGMPLPFAHIAGFGLANDHGGDQNYDIIISGGACRSAADNVNIAQDIASPITKRLDAAWAVGTGNGGLFSGAIAGLTWYHVFAIVKDSDSSVDFGFDTSVIAANRDAGYTEYRRIGSIKTNATPIIYWFRQLGDRFNWYTPKNDVDLTEPAISGSARVLEELSTPLGVKTQAYGNWNLDRNAGTATLVTLYVSDPDTLDMAPHQFNPQIDMDAAPAGSLRHISAPINVRTDILSQVGIRLNRTNTPATQLQVQCYTTSYVDERGKDGQGMI